MAKNILLELLTDKKYLELKKVLSEYNSVDLAELLLDMEDKDLAFVFRMIDKDKAAEVFLTWMMTRDRCCFSLSQVRRSD